jgi:hypothetical protein
MRNILSERLLSNERARPQFPAKPLLISALQRRAGSEQCEAGAQGAARQRFIVMRRCDARTNDSFVSRPGTNWVQHGWTE